MASTKKIKFEDALHDLEEVVSRLESGDLSLDESLAAFENGMKLAKTCEQKLNETSGKVEKIMKEIKNDV